MLKDVIRNDSQEWETFFSPRHQLHLHPLAKRLNRVGTIQRADENAGLDVTADMDSATTIATIAPDQPPSWWGG